MTNPFATIDERLSKIEALLASIATIQGAITDTGVRGGDLMAIDEACQFLGLAKPTIYNLVHRKEVPHFKRGKRLYFSKADLEAWVKQARRKTISQVQSEELQGRMYI